MTEDPEFTPGQRVRHEDGDEGVIVVGAPDAGGDVVYRQTRHRNGLDTEVGGSYWVVAAETLTPITDTVEITVSLTRRQVEQVAMWEPSYVSGPTAPYIDACRSWLASEGER